MNSNSDKQLVQAAASGCIDSFGQLYERYYGSIAALAYSILADRQIAEDTAQEVFAIACRDIGNLKNKEKFGPWLAGICRNTAKQMLRTNRVTQVSSERVAASSRRDGDGDGQQIAVIQALKKLKGSERELITLRYYDNLPYETIAKVLGISIQAVNGRLLRAKRKMAKYLK